MPSIIIEKHSLADKESFKKKTYQNFLKIILKSLHNFLSYCANRQTKTKSDERWQNHSLRGRGSDANVGAVTCPDERDEQH